MNRCCGHTLCVTQFMNTMEQHKSASLHIKSMCDSQKLNLCCKESGNKSTCWLNRKLDLAKARWNIYEIKIYEFVSRFKLPYEPKSICIYDTKYDE